MITLYCRYPHTISAICSCNHATYLEDVTCDFLSLCYSIVYYYNGAQRYEQFLQVGRLY